VGAFALSVGLVLFAIVELSYPFMGDVTIRADGFEEVLRVLPPS
jgi:hypothetical protein